MQRGQTSNTTTTKPPIITLEERRNIQKRGPSEKHLTSPPLIPSTLSHHITSQEHSTQMLLLLLLLLLRSKQIDMYLNPHPHNPPPQAVRFASLRLSSPPLPTPSKKKTQKINRYQPTNNLRCAPAPALAPSSHQSIQPVVHLFPILPWVQFNHSFIHYSSIYPCAPACRHSLTHSLK